MIHSTHLPRATWLLVIAAALWVPTGTAQVPAHVAQVDSGLTQGKARLVLRHAAASVELALVGQSRQYSPHHALPRLRQFFKHFPPRSFQWVHEEARDADWFATGRYRVRATGEILRIYAHWERRNEVWELVTVHAFR